VLQALILFQELYPDYRTKEIETSIGNAATFIESRQQEDGSWFFANASLTQRISTLADDNTNSCFAG
jgi:hypothetical protein